jgi:hypothetical protein
MLIVQCEPKFAIKNKSGMELDDLKGMAEHHLKCYQWYQDAYMKLCQK